MSLSQQRLSLESARPFDVVTVPDFSSAQAAVFEARTLVFLASWLENAGAAGRFPLHLACIHEPPPSVRRLAERCGAHVSVHRPLTLRDDHHVGNKLRGLEVTPQTDRVLLLDVDVAILSDLSSLSELGTCVAASPEDAPNVAEADWQLIYAGCDLPLPPRITPLIVELGLPRFPRRMMGYEAGDRQVTAMFPYYNGGVVFAPWDCGLRELWERNIRRIAGLYDARRQTRKWIHHSDQAALAVTVAMLQQQGLAFRRLPDRFNTRWQHLYGGRPEVEQVAILHCCWSFLQSIGDGPVTSESVSRALEQFFHVKVGHRFQRLAFGDLLRLHLWSSARRLGAARQRAAQVCRALQAACRRHLDVSAALLTESGQRAA